MPDDVPPAETRSWWSAIGPAIILAAVVLGPGSLVNASKVGCEFGYRLLWVVVAAAVLMIGATVTAAAIGRKLAHTPGQELATRLGRPAAVVVGLTLFGVVVSFQGSNNAAVLAGLDPLIGGDVGGRVAAVLLLLINLVVAAVLWLGRNLYRPIERLMKLLVGVMAAGFVVNIVLARPSLAATISGLRPHLPDQTAAVLPTVVDGTLVDPFRSVAGLIATTFSIAAAYYQSYLVRERRAAGDANAGNVVDAVFGITALGLATALVMLTAAAVLHGRVDPASLTNVQAVAEQLRPTFGAAATWLFSLGILAAAFSSFLVNALIGGTLLADGLGLKSGLDDAPQKALTTLALALGAVVAIITARTGGAVEAIVLMQKLTLLGGPLLAGSLLYLAIKVGGVPKWAVALTAIGAVIVLLLAGRQIVGLIRLWTVSG